MEYNELPPSSAGNILLLSIIIDAVLSMIKIADVDKKTYLCSVSILRTTFIFCCHSERVRLNGFVIQLLRCC